MSGYLITGKFIPFEDGNYTFQDILTEINKDFLINKHTGLTQSGLVYGENTFISLSDYNIILNTKDATIEGDVDDVWFFGENGNTKGYLMKSIATKNLTELDSVKVDSVIFLNKKFAEYNLDKMTLTDSKTIMLLLNDEFEKILNFSKTNSVSVGLYSLSGIQGIDGMLYNIQTCCLFLDWLSFAFIKPKRNNNIYLHTFFLQIQQASSIKIVNDIIANAVIKMAEAQEYPADFFNLTERETNSICGNNKFIKNIGVNLDMMVDTINNYSKEELIQYGANEYTERHFRNWYQFVVLPSKVNNKYDLFTAMI